MLQHRILIACDVRQGLFPACHLRSIRGIVPQIDFKLFKLKPFGFWQKARHDCPQNDIDVGKGKKCSRTDGMEEQEKKKRNRFIEKPLYRHGQSHGSTTHTHWKQL